MKFSNYLAFSVKSVALTAATLAALASSAVTIPTTPLVTQITAKPMVMLVASKDHKLFVEAYNDATDLDGDGTLDIRFKPSITYYGLFDSKVCYTDNGKGQGNAGLFTPDSSAGTLNTCASGKWSGNWLNYVTTSRIDSLRKVLYGGYREVDTTTSTVLRRSYIPQDAHSWAKEYTSPDVDKYKISDYTPFSEPSTGRRHFFGNLTANGSTNCATKSDSSNDCTGMPPLKVNAGDTPNLGLPPLLRVRQNVGDDRRVWDWASKESVVLMDKLSGKNGSTTDVNFPAGTGAQEDYTVRVSVCTASFHEGCKQYGSNYKPTGVLHDYGENDAMLFGLLTGSYDKNVSGGVLRKVISKFSTEINPTTGQFTTAATIVKNFDSLRIRDFNNGNTSAQYRNGSYRTGPMKEGDYVDWGNPVGEMMYEGLRYFAGKKTSTAAFDVNGSHDKAVGLSRVATWDDPYSSSSAAQAPRCARPNMLVMSDVYPSYDADQIPGSPFSSLVTDSLGFNASDVLKKISDTEPGVIGSRFIGQSTTGNLDYAPTAKDVTTLATVRGLAPEETTKQGSYNSAAIAYFGHVNDVSSTAADKQTIDSYMLALSSTLPKVEVPITVGTSKKTISIVPFAKTIDGASTNRAKGYYQPTDQIVDLYITKDDLAGTSRQMQFRINYEADEQGNDYDMDVIAEYTVTANTDNTVTVEVEVKYQSTGSNQNVGYVISGTNRDGIYLVAQDKNEALDYFLNVPPGRSAGYCDSATNLAKAECQKLPYLGSATPKSTQIFTTSTSDNTAQFLHDPLWYAAKWGGFNDKKIDDQPTLNTEWDLNGDGVPDNYFLVQNPLKLRETLKRAFDGIFTTNSSASNVIANSSSVTNDTRVFQARFDANKWSGDLVAYPITGAGVSTNIDWQAANRVPAPGSRQLYIHTPSGTTAAFDWSNLSTADTALLDADPSSVDNSQDIVDYLRGVRTKEIQNSGNFRDRDINNVLGDIVHSSPFYVKDSDTVFVNANDGMLHAFKASNGSVVDTAGTELFGFIPAEAVSRLKNLAAPAYTHEFLVDGDVVVSPKSTETGNKNLLFATIGRGGKGLFGLNVTSPTSFSSSDFLWEYTPASSTAAAADADLGLMLGRPIYAKMNSIYTDTGQTPNVNVANGAVIVGNGYNSTSGKAVLYIYLLNNKGQVTSVKKLDTLAGSDNGLATPAAFDADGNGTIDYIYAGDLKGNVWKFDVSDKDPANWKVDFTCTTTACTPLFAAKNPSNNPQPITSPITVAKDNVVGDANEGKRFIFFGTGSYFRSTDPADTNVQTWYGIIDEGAAITGRTQMVPRTVAASGTFDGKPVRAFSAAVAGDMVGKKGWYLDFTSPPGERMITEPIVYKLALPALVASSIIPAANDPCIPGGTGYVNVVSPFSGGSMTLGTLDVNRNSNFKDDLLSGLVIGSIDLGIGLPSRPTLIGNRLVVGGTSPDAKKRISDVGVNLGLTPLKGRISWREIIRD